MIYYTTLLAHVTLLALMGAAAGWVRILSRQLLLCLGAFAGIGAYVTAILTTRGSFSPVAALLVAAVAGWVGGAALGRIAWRVRGVGFVLVLIALQVFCQEAVYPLRSWTNGSDGIDRIPAMFGDGFLGRARATVVIATGLTLVSVLWLKRLKSAPLGLLARAFADNPNEFAERGFDARWPLIWTYSIAGLFSAVAGGLLATTTGLVTPGEIGFAVSVTAAVIVLFPLDAWVGDYLAPFAAAICVVGIRSLLEVGFARFTANDSSWFWHVQILREVLVGGLFLWLLIPPRLLPIRHDVDATSIDQDRALALLESERPRDANGQPICSLVHAMVKRDGEEVLSPISIDVPPGTVVALVGPNGGGKTTALLTLLGRYVADSGRVIRPATDKIGYLSGSARPFPNLTSLENLRLCRSRSKNRGMFASLLHPDAEAPMAESLLDALGVGHRKHAPGLQLSWGQSRRIALAGLLSQNSWKLLLLDEPASGLDVSTRAFVSAVIRQFSQGNRAVVVAEHDRHFVEKLANQIVLVGVKDETHVSNLNHPVTVADEPLLIATNLAVGYRGAPVVEAVSFVVKRAEIILVAGRNGSGKSTLMRTLTRRLPIVGGTFETRYRLGNGGMAYVGETALFDDLTVAENLEEATRLGCGSPEFLPHSNAWKTCQRLWTRRARNLSLGEKRWLRIAMALAQGPTLLILDEPSLNLSPRSIHQMIEDVRDYATRQNAGVVVADHVIDPWMDVASAAYLIDDEGFRPMPDGESMKAGLGR